MHHTNSFKLATLAASIALAMASTAALAAAPTATQLPGAGAVVTGTTPTVSTITSGNQTITLSGNTVINWGVTSGATINAAGTASSQPGGFNIGSGATLAFGGTGAVLNVDVSGNASQIFGGLSSSAGNLFVANANGIIVGPAATISSTAGDVGLIANTLGATTVFDGTIGTTTSVGFNGTGGNVTVNTGANINGTGNVLISGGGTVNVDLSTLTAGTVTLGAGLPSGGGAFATTNANASLAVSGTLGGAALANSPTTPPDAGFAGSFASAGNASTSGTLTLGSDAAVAGTLTNTGALTLDNTGFDIAGALVNNKTVTQTGDASMGSLTNNGAYDGGNFELSTTAGGLTNSGQITTTGGISVTGGDLTNNGQISTGYTDVYQGNLVNGGAITGDGSVYVQDGNVTNNGSMAVDYVEVENGSIVNNGSITGADEVETYSDASDPLFTKGADYSITNNGTITSPDYLYFYANGGGDSVGTTGSFTNTGTLQVTSYAPYEYLEVYANNDINLGGKLQSVNGTTVTAISPSNPLSYLYLSAGNYDYDSVFTNTGTLTVSTPLAVNNYYSDPAVLAGNQVSLLSNVSYVNSDGSGNPAGNISIVAGAQQASGYTVRVGSGVTVSADEIYVSGDTAADNPNVLVNGTLSASEMYFGDGNGAISNLYTGPSGSLAMSNDPYLYLNFTGAVKTVPYNNASNFRFNGLNVNVTDGSPLTVELNPSAYTTNGTSNGLSAVNLLVNSSVTLESDLSATTAGAPTAGGSAVTGVITLPNTHLVLQSSGSIATDGSFYWPGYVYLGTVSANADGSAAPGTLGLGMITTGGEFNNVLPGDIAGASGIHFITQFPMTLGGNVITNANAWVNFGTDLLTSAYAGGTLGAGQFFGGTQGSGTVVNYGPLASADFVTQAPSATP